MTAVSHLLLPVTTLVGAVAAFSAQSCASLLFHLRRCAACGTCGAKQCIVNVDRFINTHYPSFPSTPQKSPSITLQKIAFILQFRGQKQLPIINLIKTQLCKSDVSDPCSFEQPSDTNPLRLSQSQLPSCDAYNTD